MLAVEDHHLLQLVIIGRDVPKSLLTRHNVDRSMRKRVKTIIVLAILFLIALGLWILNSIIRPEIKDEVDETLRLPVNVQLEVKPINLKTNNYPVWINDNVFVFLGTREIISYEVSTQKQTTLVKLDSDAKSLIARNNVIFVELGLPFTNIKGYKVYKIDNATNEGIEINDIDLKDYEPAFAFSLTPDSKKIRFIGKYDVRKNMGDLYSYDVDTKKVEGVIYKNIYYSTFRWITNNRAFVYKFVEDKEGETLYFLDIESKRLTQIKPTLSELSLTIPSPDNKQLLISGEGILTVRKFDNLNQDEKLKDQSYIGTWIDNENVLVTPKNSVSFSVINIKDKGEREIVTPPQLQTKTLRTLIPSPDYKHFILRTYDDLWALIKIDKLE